MKEELHNLKPILIAKTAETEEIMKKVEVETAQAEKQREMVLKDEEQTKIKE